MGRMAYMQRHGLKRARPTALVPGTLRVVTARMDYLPREAPPPMTGKRRRPPAWPSRSRRWCRSMPVGATTTRCCASACRPWPTGMQQAVGPVGHRVFTDSAPVLEAELAARSGIGWRGKHTLLLHRDAGSMFFLGEIYIDLALPLTPPT
jgi:epoxyqueuosine reductase